MKEKDFLKLFIYSFISFFCIILSISCNNIAQKEKSAEEEDTLITYIEHSYDIVINDDIKRIFYVNDLGCPTCVLTFSNFILENVNDDNSLIIVNSKGINVDIEKFKEKQRQMPRNVLIFYSSRFNETQIPNLSIIYLDENKVDSIIELKPETLKEQLETI